VTPGPAPPRAAAGQAATPADAVVLDLGDIRITDTPRVGPKLARLGQLASVGWRVPDGYAVTVQTLGSWLPPAAKSEIERLITGTAGTAAAHDPAALGRACERAQALIESQPLPSWLQDAVFAAHERLRTRTGRGQRLRVAVRSSAVGEDGAGASFAGQYSTFLGIGDNTDVLDHIRKCWASGYTAWALQYRRRASLPPHALDLAVGVMELVDVRSAGVIFTLDPVTGDRGRMVVEANWGFGESVVSGQVTPDYWAVDRASGRIGERRVGGKHMWTVFDLATAKVVPMPLPADLARQPCLNDDEVRYLCRKAAEIEDAEGVPQDIEWAIARDVPLPDSVFILQHRPETTWPSVPAAPAAAPAPASAANAQPPPTAQPSFDPVQYALRNVFKVPGT
jgi:pyruvate, water dikinase